jgi:hypothetical protein
LTQGPLPDSLGYARQGLVVCNGEPKSRGLQPGMKMKQPVVVASPPSAMKAGVETGS